MKKTLTLGMLLLGCCLAALAQKGSTSNQIPPSSSAPLPQDQTGQKPFNPVTLTPSVVPPESQVSSPYATSILGCLSQSSSGGFVLTTSSGDSFRLRGETLQLNSYVGKAVRLEGAVTSDDRILPNAIAAPTSATRFLVTDIHKVAESCTTGSDK